MILSACVNSVVNCSYLGFSIAALLTKHRCNQDTKPLHYLEHLLNIVGPGPSAGCAGAAMWHSMRCPLTQNTTKQQRNMLSAAHRNVTEHRCAKGKN